MPAPLSSDGFLIPSAFRAGKLDNICPGHPTTAHAARFALGTWHGVSGMSALPSLPAPHCRAGRAWQRLRSYVPQGSQRRRSPGGRPVGDAPGTGAGT